jgi:hypothetical protein
MNKTLGTNHNTCALSVHSHFCKRLLRRWSTSSRKVAATPEQPENCIFSARNFKHNPDMNHQPNEKIQAMRNPILMSPAGSSHLNATIWAIFRHGHQRIQP